MRTSPSPTPTNDVPRVGRSVSLDQAARLMGVCRRTVYNRIRDGRLQTIRTPGGSQRVLLDSCRPFITPERARALAKAGQS